MAVDNNGFEEFLKWNLQLTHIGIHRCSNINDNLFELIVKHVARIESVCFSPRVQEDPFEPNNIKCFGQLMNLKSLELCATEEKSASLWAVAVVKEIGGAKIHLEHLHLEGISSGDDESNRFADDMANLKNLRTLSLRSVEKLSASQVLHCCKQLSELSELYFLENEPDSRFSEDNLLELIRNSVKLQTMRCGNFYCVERNICIDQVTYMQMVKAVSNRCENISLKICLNKSAYSANIPDELVRAHKDSLTLSFAYTVAPLSRHFNGEISIRGSLDGSIM